VTTWGMMVMRQALSFALAIAFPLVAAAEPLKQEPPVPLLDRHYQWMASVGLEKGGHGRR
jgi:hypothetical protein